LSVLEITDKMYLILECLPIKYQKNYFKFKVFHIRVSMHNTNKLPESLVMQRCFDLARMGIAHVQQNPPVGAVLTICNKIVSEGFHKGFGGPHAEVNALTGINVKQTASLNACLTISLEPCSHFGKTPPCTDLILTKKLPKVIVSVKDPNPLVDGSGLDTLKKSGAIVKTGIRATTGSQLIRPFSIVQSRKRPYIILKWAQSLDGYLGKPDRRIKISHPVTDRLVHKWRYETDVILIGTQTALVDLPKLSNRLWYGKSPVKAVIDRKCKIRPDNPLFKVPGKTLVFTEMMKEETALVKPVKVDFHQNIIPQILNHLYQSGFGTVLVEGGSKTLKSFLKMGAWDEVRIIQSPHPLTDGIPAPEEPDGLLGISYLMQDQVRRYHNPIIY
jgi:diaminohydroxyphosphoribosylaminopyrimidine deaminase/5-amino-6-(5-phosphoribosylamino)uracil reductase